jgi:hypothetical protein
MRMGELFGSDKKEIAGFIKSLTFSFPDEGPWEIKKGQRVPKYVSVDITYQVIHSKVPSLDFAVMTDAKPTETFYGINKDIGTGPEGPTL